MTRKLLHFGAMAAVLVAAATPAISQERRVVQRGSAIPVWVAVQNSVGAPRVFALLDWDDDGSKLRFSEAAKEGDLVAIVDGCRYIGIGTEHGKEGFVAMKRDDLDCTSADLGAIAAEHLGSPMKCGRAVEKTDGTGEQEPSYLFFGCYWAQKPGGI